MSLVKVQGNVSGTGTLTIAAPNTNSDYTLTLPLASGTLNTSGLANEVPAGSASTPAIYPTGDTNTGIFFPAADTIAFTEGGVESMRIDSSGNVGVAVTPQTIYAPQTYKNFQLGNSTFIYTYGATNPDTLQLRANAYLDSSAVNKFIRTGTATQYEMGGGGHFWSSAASGSAGATATFVNVLGIEKDKSLALQGATPKDSCTGITFPSGQASSSDANTLDDYEEGTWTPTDASGAGLSFTLTGTASYVKIGRVCTATCFVTYPSTASGSIAYIGSLPFTIANINNLQGGSIANTNYGTAITLLGIGNDTRVAFTTFADVNITNANLSTKFIRFSFTYITT